MFYQYASYWPDHNTMDFRQYYHSSKSSEKLVLEYCKVGFWFTRSLPCQLYFLFRMKYKSSKTAEWRALKEQARKERTGLLENLGFYSGKSDGWHIINNCVAGVFLCL
ncbi:CIC_collapsed_G0004990.mRNA.1.CDS.1 [Saccharomyces cerevisiae]|nr:CIC_collapsed_G0004990.mRNA.1.CDS.1 [Saccharomyces cerevisiae]